MSHIVVRILNKKQVAKYLGVAQKTVERYVAQGKLKVVYIRRVGHYDDDEVKRLFEEINKPVHRSIVDVANLELAQVNAPVLAHLVAFLANKLLDSYDKLEHLENLERCAKHGWILPSDELKELIKMENLPRSPFFKYGFWFERTGRSWIIRK